MLINDPKDSPTPDGKSGITSSRLMDAAEIAGRAVEVGSNFFLQLEGCHARDVITASPRQLGVGGCR